MTHASVHLAMPSEETHTPQGAEVNRSPHHGATAVGSTRAYVSSYTSSLGSWAA